MMINKYIILITFFSFSLGCATNQLLEKTSSVTASPNGLIAARYIDNNVIIIHGTSQMNEYSREVKFIDRAAIFNLQNTDQNLLTGKFVDIPLDDFYADRVIDNLLPMMPPYNKTKIFRTQGCPSSFEGYVGPVVCGTFSDNFKVGVIGNDDKLIWQQCLIPKRNVKTKKPFLRYSLFPFALCADIVLSPVYLVGGTIIIIYVGMAGPE